MEEIKRPEPQRVSERAPRDEYVSLGRELSKVPERFPFPGIAEDSYATAKAEAEALAGLATPIDELIERFKQHGIKIATNLAENPENHEAYVLPGDSDDIESDGLPPRYLAIGTGMNSQLSRLITLSKELKKK